MKNCNHKNFKGGYPYNFYLTTHCNDCGAVYDKDKKQWMYKASEIKSKKKK